MVNGDLLIVVSAVDEGLLVQCGMEATDERDAWVEELLLPQADMDKMVVTDRTPAWWMVG